MKKVLVVLSALLLFAACSDQDPYGGKEPTEGAPPKKDDKPKEPEPGADSLQIQDIMTFNEGVTGEYIVRATVRGAGKPVLSFTNLPSGVHYDSATERLKWTPDYKAANETTNPSIVIKHYYVDVVLTSDAEPGVMRKAKSVTLVVNDTPMPASVKSSLDARGREGQQLSHTIMFEDQEFPTGPFEVAISGLPADSILEWPDRRVPQFTLRWTPQYDKIINKNVEDYVGHVQLFNPRGKRLDFNIRWSVNNQYIAPDVAGPTSVAQPGDMDFIVMAEDPNNETPPEWDFRTRPPYGIVSITNQPVTGTGKPKTTGIVSWKAVPKDKLGLVQTIELQACVQYSYCKTHKVTLLPMAHVVGKGVKK